MIRATLYIFVCEFSPVVTDYLEWSTLSAVDRDFTHTDFFCFFITEGAGLYHYPSREIIDYC